MALLITQSVSPTSCRSGPFLHSSALISYSSTVFQPHGPLCCSWKIQAMLLALLFLLPEIIFRRMFGRPHSSPPQLFPSLLNYISTKTSMRSLTSHAPHTSSSPYNPSCLIVLLDPFHLLSCCVTSFFILLII